MLILLLRIAFVTLAIVVGLGSGQHYFRSLEGALPPWFGGAMGFGIAITLIAAQHAFRRKFTRSLIGFLIGLGTGLLLSLLVLTVLREVIQDPAIYNNLDIPVALITTYLVMITVLQNIDRFRVVIPFVELRAERHDGGAVVVDGSVLGDGRLAALVGAGLLPQRLLVHRQVITACEIQANAQDLAEQARGHRALEGLAELRKNPSLSIEIDETEIPNANAISDVLVRLTRLENARLLANDRDILQRAKAEGIAVIDLQALANALVPSIRAGEIITVRIDKPGEGKNQGVGFLDDGSMVIVAEAGDRIGQRVRCTVLRLHPTANGRMVFAERSADASSSRHPAITG